MSAIPLHIQRRFEQRWASRFTPPVASNPPKMLERKLHHQPVAAPRDKDPRKTRRRDRRA
jgi:hypothetical protein